MSVLNMPEAYHRFTFHDQKFFRLRMMIVISTRDSGGGAGYKYLTSRGGFDEFCQRAARIMLLLQVICKIIGLKISSVGTVEFTLEFIMKIGNEQRLAALTE
jgi:hypothetical protein